MLSHYRKRADECASRLAKTNNEILRREYQRLLDNWTALIQAEEARLTKISGVSRRSARSV